MRETLRRLLRNRRLAFLKHGVFLARGLWFVGRRFCCPCCGWKLRGFVGRWGLWTSNRDGYCPRCNSKARHRRLWLFLEKRADLTRACCMLEVAPWWSFARRLRRMPKIRFVGLDLECTGPQVNLIGDARAIPLAEGSCDLALCVHVLEHIPEDTSVIAELYRVLKPGGHALVSVPLRLDGPTLEDPTVTDPEERARLFGERGHVRYYGLDLGDRLRAAGFEVSLDRASEIPRETQERFGLRIDENIFCCRKPSLSHDDA